MSIDRIDSSRVPSSLLNLEAQVSRELSSDPGAEIAALLLLGASESRDRSQALRHAQEQRLVRFENSQVDQMYDQAEAIRAAGWSRGIGAMAGGALGVVGAADGAPEFQGYAQIANGTGEMLGATQDSFAKMHEANATSANNSAKKAERAIQDLNQTENEASELQRTALQAASELVQTQAQGNQATLYLRG